MNKGKITTTVGFLLCWFIVMGGWLLTRELLNKKEENLYGKTGQISLQSSEIAFLGEREAEGERAGEGYFFPEGRILSEEEMAVILDICEAGGSKVLHEPVEGQIGMEQAMAEGRSWVMRLANENVLPSAFADCHFDKAGAQLYSLDAKAIFAEELLSFWQVSFEGEDIKIELSVHAVSGQVWEADVLMNDGGGLFEAGGKEGILKLVFPFMEEGPFVMTDNKTDITYSIFEKGWVYAAMKQDLLKINGKDMLRLHFWLCTSNSF